MFDCSNKVPSQKTPSKKEPLFFCYVILKSAPKGVELDGWSKVPILTLNFSSLYIVRRQKGKEILDIHHSKPDMMPRTEK